MNVEIEADGTLVIYPKTALEEYAMKRWLDEDHAVLQLRKADRHWEVAETHDVWEDGVPIPKDADEITLTS